MVNVAPAHEACREYGAQRGAKDPIKRGRATRIVRVALRQGDLTLADVLPPDDYAAELIARWPGWSDEQRSRVTAALASAFKAAA